jgi:hypothetical protein
VLYCLHDAERSVSFLDFDDCATHLALGAVVENIAIVAPTLGLEPSIDTFPDVDLERCVAAIRFTEIESRPDALADVVAKRVTNRRLGERLPLSAHERQSLVEAAAHRHAILQLCTEPGDLDAITDVLARGDRVRFLSQVMHREMMSEMRWTPEEVIRTRDGIDIATLEMTPTDLAGMRLISSWSMMKVVQGIGAGRGLEKPTRKAMAAASALGLVTVEGTTKESYFAGGRALQRVWLAATACGLAVQPMAALIYLFARLERGGGVGLCDSEKKELFLLRQRYLEVLPVLADHAEIMLFRVAHAGAPTARALRRHVDDILTIVA